MTGEIVNLNKARKAKAKQDAKASAKTNRAWFGRGKAERTMTEIERRRAERALDQHQRDGETPDEG